MTGLPRLFQLTNVNTFRKFSDVLDLTKCNWWPLVLIPVALCQVQNICHFLKPFIQQLGNSLPISLLVNNQSVITLAENPIFHTHSKHIEVHHHWMHEKTGDRTIQLEYVPMADQVVDIFTKPLNSEKFQKFCDALGLVWISAC